MARSGAEKRRISIRIDGELVDKVKRWEDCGLPVSDIVRLSLSLLPYSPDQLQKIELPLAKVNPTRRGVLKIAPKDEKEALRGLQEW